MRVVFDVDGVLRDLMTAFVPYVGRAVVEIDDCSRPTEWAGGIENFYAILNDNDLWRRAPAYEHFIRMYHELSMVFQVILVTHNVRVVGRRSTIDWLVDHDLAECDELHFCKDKLTVAFDAIIEDCPKTAMAAAKAGRAAFLVHRPWTMSVKTRHPNLFRLPPDEEAATVIREVLAR